MHWNHVYRRVGKPYRGPVAFVDGVHYAAPDGHPDSRQPLRWDEDGYVYARKTDPTHQHVHQRRVVEVEQD